MKKLTAIFIAAATVLSCAQQHEQSTADASSALTEIATGTGELVHQANANLIRKAHYRFQARDVRKSIETIEQAVLRFTAHVSSSNLSLDGNLLENRMTIRVRGEHFDALLKEIDREAYDVKFRNVTTNDVSAQFVDMEARLKAKREVEARYVQILRTRTGTVKEIMEAENQIGDIHEEIEATVSRINFLKDQVRYSTIDLEFYQVVPAMQVSPENNTSDRFIVALRAGLQGVTEVLLVLAALWPAVAIVVGGYTIWRVRKKKLAIGQLR